MEMKLFGDDLRVEVDIWELFQFHDRHDRSQDLVKLYDLWILSGSNISSQFDCLKSLANRAQYRFQLELGKIVPGRDRAMIVQNRGKIFKLLITEKDGCMARWKCCPSTILQIKAIWSGSGCYFEIFYTRDMMQVNFILKSKSIRLESPSSGR